MVSKHMVTKVSLQRCISDSGEHRQTAMLLRQFPKGVVGAEGWATECFFDSVW